MKPALKLLPIYLAFLLVMFLLTSYGYSQVQRFSGEVINTTMTWSGTIVIAGDVTIESEGRLEIEPGTEILFEPGIDLSKSGDDKTRAELIVRGTVIARGLPGKRINFSSRAPAPRMGDWYGLTFMHLKSGSILDYCVVEYAYTGITIKNSTMIVSNSEVRYNYHAGIKTEVKAKPNLINNIVSNNGYAGIICELGAKPILTDNLISLNRIGIVAYSLSQPNFGSLRKDENYNPGRNHIFNNEEYNFYNHSTKPIQAEFNAWGDESTASISEKLYDKNDNAKFGQIDFLPLMNESGRPALGNMLLLSQNSAVKDSTAPAGVKSSSKKSEADSALALSQQNERTSGRSLIPGIDELSQDLDKANPLIASNAPSKQVVNKLSPASTAAEKIDYDQIFLELFLDGGGKTYLAKPKLRINSILKNVLEPGEIRVKVTVARSGRVDQASILKGINEILDEAVLETVKRYRYKGGTVNGRTVKFTTSEVFRFE